MLPMAVTGSVELVDVSDKLPGLVRENGVYSWRVCVSENNHLYPLHNW